jgi:hypothetical protein
MACRSIVITGFVLAAACLMAGGCSQLAPCIQQRELCAHFRAEPWPEGSSVEDKERRDFIAGQLDRYCTGTSQAVRD